MDEGWYRGSLKDLALAKALRRLQMGTKTGVLRVAKEGYIVNIFVRDGDVIFATSSSDEERLGELLLREEKITFEEYNQARNLIETRRERMGRIFVELCCLTPKEVVLAVRHQIEEIVMNLFTLESGSYEFREGELPSDEMITIHASTSTIIYRGVRRIRNVMLARKICPPEDGVLGLSSSPLDLFQEINLDDRDKIILSYMNGRTLKMILSLSPMQDFDTMRTICALMTVGLVTTRREGDSPSPVTVENLLKEPDEGVSENFLVEVEEMLRGCDSSGCYEILGLERGASEEEIESAYFRLAKRFHPDRHYSLPTHDIKKGLIRIFSCITHAYELLMDREKRQAYDMNPSPVKDAVTEEIPESIFTLSGITDTVGASGETAGEIAGEAEEEESAVPPEDGGDREDERKTPEPVDLDGETPFQDGPLTPSARIEAKTAADKAGEVPEEAAVPVEKGGIEVEKTRMILEEIGTENRGGDFSEEKTEPVAVEEPRKRGHGVLMPVAVTVVLVVLVALAVSLTYQDRKEVPVAPVSPSATVENEGMRGASREVYVELPTFRDDLFRKFLHDSEKREDD